MNRRAFVQLLGLVAIAPGLPRALSAPPPAPALWPAPLLWPHQVGAIDALGQVSWTTFWVPIGVAKREAAARLTTRLCPPFPGAPAPVWNDGTGRYPPAPARNACGAIVNQDAIDTWHRLHPAGAPRDADG